MSGNSRYPFRINLYGIEVISLLEQGEVDKYIDTSGYEPGSPFSFRPDATYALNVLTYLRIQDSQEIIGN